MLDGLTFGWRTALLTVAVVQLLLLAVALSRTMANRIANRTLALLLVVLAGIVMPWLIGFAGFYDRWHWLTFAPFAITLAVAPLAWLYVTALVTGALPIHARRHLLPAALQLAFLTASFLLPMSSKNAWADLSYRSYDQISGAGTILGLALYGRASLRLLRRYRAALAANRSDDHCFAAAWASRAIAALLVLLVIWTGYNLWDWVAPLGYQGLMGLYVAIAAVALYLGVEGWRHANLPFPPLSSLIAARSSPAPPRDWSAIGARYAALVREERWHADPDLSLALLARRLGTNTGQLSRALNDGLGVNFSTFVNRLRCESIAARLDGGDGGDLLDLAFDEGFRSKASFNRVFQATFGTTPSAYRRRHVSKAE